ncbi:phosphodiester glycosidase family protein [Fictibacillus sp. KIGAM418]|uniref:Phosphodiester glycosidase family protein n=1 Tax=Fictibacillus marinisediminis TaxID=2878389 RepID=A0A9X1XC47_9BACL|nr:phosphodiester glycosidase family protein [Fictibacillus marinisediminis]MCK6257105.1 phosphodiester glycosidase family protein [Fictibacillus marinisediminis]
MPKVHTLYKSLIAIPIIASTMIPSTTMDKSAIGGVVHAQTQTFSTQTETNKLPLGSPDLQETRKTVEVAPGVTQTDIKRGTRSDSDVYTVDVKFVKTHDEAEKLSGKLTSQGYHPRIETISNRPADDNEQGPLGYLVRVGSYTTEDNAKAMQQKLEADGYTGLKTVYTGEDGKSTTGPWNVNILEVDPDQYKGHLSPALSNDVVTGKETVTSLGQRHHAIAGINGGYFVMADSDGTPGDLAGISMIGGELISEAVNNRSSLIIPSSSGQDASISSISSKQTAVSSDGISREVDGLNRKPGQIRGCGGVGGDAPTELPKHDFTCTDGSELIQYTSSYGETADSGVGAEAVLDAAGKVVQVRYSRGGTIPKEGSVLAGTGEAASWLQKHAKAGMKISVNKNINEDGQPLKVEDSTELINGGPRLLKGGEVSLNPVEEGFHMKDNPEFYYRFGERRNPRTLAGIKPNGNLLFVTIDGHEPGWSVGANFNESAAVIKSLGAKDALNLDGGGSTTMTVGNKLKNRPSDPTGERPIGDAILLLP